MLQTPLHRAAQSDHTQACRVLLMNGADQTVRSACGVTPSQIAAENAQKVFQGGLGKLAETKKDFLSRSVPSKSYTIIFV